MAPLSERQSFEGTGLSRWSLGVSLLGWVGMALGFAIDRSAAYVAYLAAFGFATSIALGALVFLMTAYVVNAKWHVPLRRLLESVVSVFPALFVTFLPIAWGLGDLYLWANPPGNLPEHELHALHHKAPYLNRPFFIARAVLYFAIWTTASLLLCRWSSQRDQHTSAPASRAWPSQARERALSAGLLPAVALALTFAAFDWLMSLDPFWVSSIFGVYFFAGGFVAAFGLLSILAYCAERDVARDVIRGPHFHALGRLMFGFTIFWAYGAFFQAMLVQIVNRPEEVVFYTRRLAGIGGVLTALIVFVRFVAPFFFLLPRAIKFSPRAMALAGAWIVAGHYLDLVWLALPAHAEHGPVLTVWHPLALCAVVGPCVFFAAFWLRGKAIVPSGDPLLPAGIEYRSPS